MSRRNQAVLRLISIANAMFRRRRHDAQARPRLGADHRAAPRRPRNKITDVPGVTVGHCTVDTPEHKTGVTILLPCPENPFVHKLPAAECAEEAVLNSLLTAQTTVGWQGNTVTALTDLWTPEERR